MLYLACIFGYMCPMPNVSSLRNASRFQLPKIEARTNGVETVSFLERRLWNALPKEWENSRTIIKFKRKIKK